MGHMKHNRNMSLVVTLSWDTWNITETGLWKEFPRCQLFEYLNKMFIHNTYKVTTKDLFLLCFMCPMTRSLPKTCFCYVSCVPWQGHYQRHVSVMFHVSHDKVTTNNRNMSLVVTLSWDTWNITETCLW
jgi:hypothetical protein